MTIKVDWKYIIENAREQARLKKEGKFFEADKLEQDLRELVLSCDEVILPPYQDI